jgi:hypothetical protein
MASEEWEVCAGDKVGARAKLGPPRRRNSPKSPDAEVALYDVTNNRFQTVKRRDAESGRRLDRITQLCEELMSTTGMAHQTVDLPRWSKKTDVFLPEPEDAKREYYVATLHLRKLGLTYTIQRWFCSGCELYIVGL